MPTSSDISRYNDALLWSKTINTFAYTLTPMALLLAKRNYKRPDFTKIDGAQYAVPLTGLALVQFFLNYNLSKASKKVGRPTSLIKAYGQLPYFGQTPYPEP